MPPGSGCGQQARQPRADQVFPVQLADPVVACRDPVEGLRAGPRRWRQMAVRLARVRGGSAPAAWARKGSAARMWGTSPGASLAGPGGKPGYRTHIWSSRGPYSGEYW